MQGPRRVSEWRRCGTSLVVSGDGVPVKVWAAEDWKALVDAWSRGATHARLEEEFAARGYQAAHLQLLFALLYATPGLLPPIDHALFVLGGLGRRDDAGVAGFTLCGRPARAAEVVYAANRMLGALALPSISYPGAAA